MTNIDINVTIGNLFEKADTVGRKCVTISVQSNFRRAKWMKRL
jgi:hypothetical protein